MQAALRHLRSGGTAHPAPGRPELAWPPTPQSIHTHVPASVRTCTHTLHNHQPNSAYLGLGTPQRPHVAAHQSSSIISS